MLSKKRIGNWLLDWVAYIIGSILYSASFNIFTVPNNIAPGGLSGIAIVLNHLLGFPVGTTILVLNIPIFMIGAKILGLKFLSKTIVATVMASLFIDLLAPFMPAYTGDSLLSALYGGVLMGAGMGIIFLRGGTTGGTDIIARVVNKAKPHLSMGRIILLFDAVIITGAGIAYRSVNSALYAVIVIFSSSMVIDRILYGMDAGKAVMVVSGKNEEIAKAIMDRMQRGVTLLEAHVAYTKEKRNVIYCVVRRHETSRLRKLIDAIDPHAFMTIGDVGEIIGEGFKEGEKRESAKRVNAPSAK